MSWAHHLFKLSDWQPPPQIVIRTADIGTFLGLVLVLMGFAYLLFGVQVFRLITTLQAILLGLLIGAGIGLLIDSVPIGMLLTSVIADLSTWHHTRWVSALVVGLSAAVLCWISTANSGINSIGVFFVSFAAAVIVGAPVLMFYRVVIMLYTSLSGAAMVVIGAAAAIVILRAHTFPRFEHIAGHLVVGSLCTLLLAIPSFFFQYTRYPAISEDENPAVEAEKQRLSFT